MLITEIANLRTLDLGRTGLGDVGIPQVFNPLASHKGVLLHSYIYLHATGIGHSACKALSSCSSSL